MALDFHETANGQIVIVQASGMLSKENYEHFVPETERQIQQFGKIRVLFEMQDFHGWEMGAVWENTKFDLKHFNQIERLAVVGAKAWEHGMSVFCRPFMTAKIQHFERTEFEKALN